MSWWNSYGIIWTKFAFYITTRIKKWANTKHQAQNSQRWFVLTSYKNTNVANAGHHCASLTCIRAQHPYLSLGSQGKQSAGTWIILVSLKGRAVLLHKGGEARTHTHTDEAVKLDMLFQSACQFSRSHVAAIIWHTTSADTCMEACLRALTHTNSTSVCALLLTLKAH